MNYNQKVGRFGEELAKNYLIRRGYKIIGLNIRQSYQELDIVARQGGLVVFVEVKTRIGHLYGPAENAFVYSKLKRMTKGMEMFMRANKISADNIRADLITVDVNKSKQTAKIKHYQDII